jgi:hypothetical protein
MTPQRWQRGPYVLEFVPREQGNFLSGYMRLLVPAEQITPGKPVELRVAHVDGSPFAFFQVKGRDDTVQTEHLTVEGLVPRVDGDGVGSDTGPGTGNGKDGSPPPQTGGPPA